MAQSNKSTFKKLRLLKLDMELNLIYIKHEVKDTFFPPVENNEPHMTVDEFSELCESL